MKEESGVAKGVRGIASVINEVNTPIVSEEEGEDCLVQRRYIPGLGDVIIMEKGETDRYGCRLND